MSTAAIGRRIKAVRMSHSLLIQMFTVGFRTEGLETIEGLPEGSEFVGTGHDERLNVFFLFHSSIFRFDPVG